MPKRQNGRDDVRTVAGTIADLLREIRGGRVSEVVRALEGMTEDRRGAVLSTQALLEEAVTQRQCQIVERLADLGAQIKGDSWGDDTPLTLAVRNDDGRMVDVLMSRGLAAVEEEPLFECLFGGFDDTMSAVLCCGYSGEIFHRHVVPMIRDLTLSSLELLVQCHVASDGLLLSCWCDLHDEDLEDALGLFVSLGVDFNTTVCLSGATVLGECTARRDTRRMRLLLDAGADPCVSNDKGGVPLDFIILDRPESWDPPLQDLLFAGAVAPPLMVLFQRHVRDVEALSWLMQAGSLFGDLSVVEDERLRYRCLFASCRGDVLRLLWHVIGHLLLSLRDLTGRTLLHHLSFTCDTSFADFDFAGNLLLRGSVSGAGTVVEDLVFLLERSEDPNVATIAGVSAIFSAVSHQDHAPTTMQKCALFVDELISFGASLATPANQRHGPLMVEWECGGQLLPMLLDRGADIRDLEDDDHARFLESLSEHCHSLGPAILRHFVEGGLDLSLDPRVKTPLHTHLVSVARRWTPVITDTETIYIRSNNTWAHKKQGTN